MSNKYIAIIKNNSNEGPGQIEHVLINKKIPYQIIDLDAGDSLPNINSISALIVLGGPDSANDQNDKIISELKFIRNAVDQNIPYLGICLGLQLVVKALGGSVRKNHVKEIAFRDPENNLFEINLNQAGKSDSIFNGLAEQINVFHLHGECVELTKAMTLLASGKFCENQVVKVSDKTYGFQCHFELTEAMLEDWMLKDPDLLKINPVEITADFKSLKNDYFENANKIINNFLSLAKV